MKREIKFRCFYRGKMYPVKELYGMDSMSVNAIEMHIDGLGVRTVSPDSEHVEAIMQYTGLKDKNGRLIYEGDIFRIEEDNGMECDFCDGTGSVEGGKYIETTCEQCNGTGIIDQGDRVCYVVIVWVKEWAMFCSLLIHSEYEAYLRDGIKGLDEPMFWTYTLEDSNSRKHFLCGNIYENENLLKAELL